jgi:hypothetical protein
VHLGDRYLRAFYILHGDAHFELKANTLSALNKLFMNRLSGPSPRKFTLCGTGRKACYCFVEQALRPVPQENLLFVKQAGKPVIVL